jgi:hypothetical protein
MARSTKGDAAIQDKSILIETQLKRELISWMATHVLHFFALRAQKCRRLAMTQPPLTQVHVKGMSYFVSGYRSLLSERFRMVHYGNSQ